jgi:hypothetical protein
MKCKNFGIDAKSWTNISGTVMMSDSNFAGYVTTTFFHQGIGYQVVL